MGHKALKLLGREPRGIEVHRPIRCGTIFNFEVAQKMLRTFIGKVTDGYRRGHFVVGIPGSATAVEQRSVRDAARDAGGRRIDLVDEGLAAGLGAGLSFDDERAHLVVDIGGGTTNIAIVASGGVVNSMSLTAAGNAMDESIRDYVRSNYCLQIGEYTAEALKRELGALSDEDIPADERKVQVVGKQLSDGSACAVQITAEEVREALEPIINEIVTGVQTSDRRRATGSGRRHLLLRNDSHRWWFATERPQEPHADGTETSRHNAGRSDQHRRERRRHVTR